MDSTSSDTSAMFVSFTAESMVSMRCIMIRTTTCYHSIHSNDDVEESAVGGRTIPAFHKSNKYSVLTPVLGGSAKS
jgi:hypothetical protein